MHFRLPFLLVCVLLVLAACDPMAPQPTPVVIVVSPEPSATPLASPTPRPTQTPLPTATPDVTPTNTPFPCESDSGRVLEFNENLSPIANENLRYHVYVPPCYQETQLRYPYVILLHGLSFREQQWAEIGAIEALDQGIRLGALPPMLLVMPYMGEIGQLNQFPPDPSYETIILEELVPAIENDFCTWEDREHRAIGGISRGGFWAYSIGLRNPDIFSIIGGHSAVFPDTDEVPAAFNPVEIARNSSLVQEADLRLYLDNAVADPAGQTQQALSNELEANDVVHTYVINPSGGHDNEYWSTQVTQYLTFYGREWPRSYGALPSCLEPSP